MTEQSNDGKEEYRTDSKSYIEQLEAERLSPNRLAETTKEMMVPIPKMEKREEILERFEACWIQNACKRDQGVFRNADVNWRKF